VSWGNELLDAVCRVCGCSHFAPCEGGCVWAEPDLCSRCAQEASTVPDALHWLEDSDLEVRS
jgi:hypothetical protein